MKLTKKIVDALNLSLEQKGCIFRFEFKESVLPDMIVVPVNTQFLHSWILNLSDEAIKYVETFLEAYQITNLQWNNTRSVAWSL